MTRAVLMRLLFAAVLSVSFAAGVSRGADREKDLPQEGDRGRYSPFVDSTLLPLMAASFLAMGFAIAGWRQTWEMAGELMLQIALSLSIYFLLLLLAAPLLRRYFSARTCALLWIFPNYLYIPAVLDGLALPGPLLVLPIQGRWIGAAAVVWAVGAGGMLLWAVLSHIVFRRRILLEASPVVDPAVLSVWEAEKERAGVVEKQYVLVRSPEVRTPLSLGFFQRSIRVVLPERTYTPAELSLIFRHELVHIGREDCRTKFFLVFCKCLCWFNPLVWMAMRRSADDLELSCDEAVLLEADDETRRQYARLLLTTAGEERGFTTCLSASAAALRYRLRCVVRPGQRRMGILLGVVLLSALVMGHGAVTLAYQPADGETYLFPQGCSQDYAVHSIRCQQGSPYGEEYYGDFTDEQALLEHLSGLRMSRLSGRYEIADLTGVTEVYMDGPGGEWTRLRFLGRTAEVTSREGEMTMTRFCRLEEPLQWEELRHFADTGHA